MGWRPGLMIQQKVFFHMKSLKSLKLSGMNLKIIHSTFLRTEIEKSNLNAKLHSLNWLWSDLILNIASRAIINMIEFVRFIFWSHLFKFTFQWIETLLWYCGTLNRYIDIIQEFEFCFITKYCYRKLSLYSNQLNNKWRISLSFAHT